MKPVSKDLNWWRKRTTLEKCLTVVSTFACLFVTCFISGGISLLLRHEISAGTKATSGINNASSLPLLIWLTKIKASASSKSKNSCNSPECLRTAAVVLDKMNPAIDPCDDFYEFACGKFIQKTKIPQKQESETMFTLLSKTLKEQVEKIIMQERPKAEPKYLRLPNDFYKACMNTHLIESLGTQPIQQISDSLGGWPVIVGKSWNSDNSWSWQETTKKLRRLGLSMNNLLHISVGADWRNSTKYIIQVNRPVLNKAVENLLQVSVIGVGNFNYEYVLNYMTDIAVMFGAVRKAAKQELTESLQFQIDLTNNSLSTVRSYSANSFYNLRTIQQLQVSYPYIQWLDLINAFLPEGQEVDENEVVNLMAPDFFDQLGKLLARTNKRVIANYMMWNMYEPSLSFLTNKFRDQKFKFDDVFLGKDLQKVRRKECADMVTSNLNTLVGSLFIREHFKEDSKDTALQTVNNIRDALDHMLDNVKWMDENTRQEAKKKLHDMKTFIGYPDDLIDNNKLEKYYRDLEIDSQKYFESYLNIKAFKMDNMFKKLKIPTDEDNWISVYEPDEVNAFYAPKSNTIQFPSGILQDPFFNRDLPKYMNYGAIGSIIGHEITHGFDLQLSQCIVEQYANYTDKQTGLKINGRLSQKENTADIGGIQLSYFAYEKWMVENGEEKKLPGLNYTPRQMFWISFAQMWCAKYDTNALKNIIRSSPHPPSEFRVVGLAQNMKDFSLDFQCPDNTPMNPMNTCEVWWNKFNFSYLSRNPSTINLCDSVFQKCTIM